VSKCIRNDLSYTYFSMHSFDIGPILMQQSFPLSTNITMFELLKMSADIGCSLVNINPECLKIALWLLF
jgi:methionyl-tRNA formyltransferase